MISSIKICGWCSLQLRTKISGEIVTLVLVLIRHTGPNEPQQDKTNKITCAPNVDWDEPSLSEWRNPGSLATRWVHTKDYDQTGPMPRLIWVFTRHTYHFVGFVMLPLKYFTCLIVLFSLQERHAAKTVGDMKQFVTKLPHLQQARTSLATRKSDINFVYTVLQIRIK